MINKNIYYNLYVYFYPDFSEYFDINNPKVNSIIYKKLRAFIKQYITFQILFDKNFKYGIILKQNQELDFV